MLIYANCRPCEVMLVMLVLLIKMRVYYKNAKIAIKLI